MRRTLIITHRPDQANIACPGHALFSTIQTWGPQLEPCRCLQVTGVYLTRKCMIPIPSTSCRSGIPSTASQAMPVLSHICQSKRLSPCTAKEPEMLSDQRLTRVDHQLSDNFHVIFDSWLYQPREHLLLAQLILLVLLHEYHRRLLLLRLFPHHGRAGAG
jgi:hypothetical protein